ncbi:MAG TPA: class I SAM-dependent rRNA methyltransferase [Polyangia bacterium]|nr:class I SAM-dependent rRNA methyltransferase [Polyangia bacterium]
MPPQPPKRRRAPGFEPKVRRGTVRITPDIAARLRAGHPYLFREALGGRPLRESAGELLEIVDDAGEFVARGLYDPDGVVAVRVLSRDPNEILDGAAMEARVRAAQALREQLLPREGMTAYRVLHGEGDGLPGVTVDRYADHLVVHLFSPSVESIRDGLYDALEAVWKPRAIYEQKRYKPLAGDAPRGPAQLARGEVAPVELEVEEYGTRFVVDVTAPLGTGLFLDLREGRRSVAERAAGKRVLNLFSYTGAFSVYAAKAGAREIVSVDLAPKAHARARRNLQANGLPETGHELIPGDTFKVLARMAERKRKFDLIVLDPPSFSQAKGRVFSVQKDYRELVEAALSVAASNALIACVSNTMKMSVEELDRAIGEAAGRERRILRVVERRGLPADFPVPAGFADGHYLKFFLCAVI